MSLNLAQLLPSRLKQRSKVILVIKFAMAMRTASCMFQKRIKINWKNGVKFDLQNPKHGLFCQWSWNRNNQILDVEAKNQHLQILSKGIRCIHQHWAGHWINNNAQRNLRWGYEVSIRWKTAEVYSSLVSFQSQFLF